MKLERAVRLASNLRQDLQIANIAVRVEIAGSVRRRSLEVKDIELVAIPRVRRVSKAAPTLFDQGGCEEVNLLWQWLEARCADGFDTYRRHPRTGERAAPWGEKYRKFLYRGESVDLFTASEDTWGNILLIRTGPAAFSRRWVSGLKYVGLKHKDGWVTRRGERLPCPSEDDAFGLVGWPDTPPPLRG